MGSYTKLIAETQSVNEMRDDISATHLLEALANLARQSIDKGELTTNELIDMIKNYQGLKKVEFAATRFKKCGEEHLRKERGTRIAADRWLKKTKPQEQALDEHLLDSNLSHDV